MAIIKGYNGVIDVAGAVVAQVREFELVEGVERMDATVMGSGFEQAAGGLSGGTVTIGCYLDPADASGQEVLIPGATVSLKLFPDGVGSGKASRAFDAVIEDVTIPQTARENVQRNFSGWVNSAMDRTPQV